MPFFDKALVLLRCFGRWTLIAKADKKYIYHMHITYCPYTLKVLITWVFNLTVIYFDIYSIYANVFFFILYTFIFMHFFLFLCSFSNVFDGFIYYLDCF